MKPTRSTIKLAAVGDLMLGDHPVCIGHGIRSTMESKGFDFITEELSPKLQNVDIAFGNLESVLSDYGYNPDLLPSAELRGRPGDAKNLAKLGFNVINIANNHAMQHGVEAFEETVALLESENIDVIGLNKNCVSNLLLKELNGVNVAFLGYSLRPEKFCNGITPYALSNEQDIITQIKKLASNFDGAIILSLHWGEEYLNYPSTSQMLFARKLIDEGVSLILGHHPHVLQGVEKYQSGLIVYSLGNFIFDKWQKTPRETILFFCDITNEGVADYKYEPVYIRKDYKLTIASGRVKRRILKNLKHYNDKLVKVINDNDLLGSEQQYLKASKNAYFKFRMQSYLYFISHIYRYDLMEIVNSALRFFRRRLGLE